MSKCSKCEDFEKTKLELEKIKATVLEKEREIKNINEIYEEKFSEVFIENAKMLTALEEKEKQNKINYEKLLEEKTKELKTEQDKIIEDMTEELKITQKTFIEEKDNEYKLHEEKLKNENKLLKEILVKNETSIKDLQDSKISLEKKIELLKKEAEENIKIKESEHINKIKTLNEEKEILINQKKDAEISIQDLKEKNKLIESDSKTKISEYEKLLSSSNKESVNSELIMQKIKKEHLEEINIKQQIIDDKLKDQKEMNKKIENMKEENQNLREIITKDQLRIKELKEFKLKTETSNESHNLTLEENRVLKNEINLFKSKLEEEMKKVEAGLMLQEEFNKQKDDFQREILKKEKIIENSNKIIDDLKEKISENQKKLNKINEVTEVKVVTSLDSLALTRECIIDYLYCLYLYDNSVNLQGILNTLLNNLNLYMSTLFVKSSSSSLISDLLENLFMRVFFTGTCKMGKLKFESEDLDLNSIKELAKEFYNNNPLIYLNLIGRQEKTLDDIIEIFFKKYEKSFDYGDIKFSEYVSKEIKPVVVEKIKNHQKIIIEELVTLVHSIIKNFQNGKVIFNNRTLYDFNRFDPSSVDLTGESLTVSNVLVTEEAADNLLFLIKRNSRSIQNIVLHNCLNSVTVNIHLARLSQTMILHCPNISSLSITDCSINESSVEYLIKLIEFLKSLKFLDLSGNSLKETGLKFLSEGLKNNRTLVTLYLNKNSVDSNGGFYLADALIKNQTLEKLSLSGNRINGNGLSSLLTVLAHNNKTLKNLDISSNNFNSEDFKIIGEFLSSGESISILNLSGNSIDPISAHLISLNLRLNKKLSVLYLENTNLNEESAPLFMKNITDSKICELYLDNNPLGEVGGIIVANAIKIHNSIKYISLKKCNLTSMALMLLTKALAHNIGLDGLNLEENTFDELSLTTLFKYFQSEVCVNKALKVYLTSRLLSKKIKDLAKDHSNNIVLY